MNYHNNRFPNYWIIISTNYVCVCVCVSVCVCPGLREVRGAVIDFV